MDAHGLVTYFITCWITDMASATQFEVSMEDIATALVRHLGIHEGLWTVGANFHFTAKNLGIGTDGKQMRPGFLGLIKNINLVRVTEAVPGLSVDAAQVNPNMAITLGKGRKTN